MPTYRAVPGAHFQTTRVQEFGEYLQVIQDKNGGISAQYLIDHREEGPLSEYFLSADRAAEMYWLQQAYHLINHIGLVKKGEDGKEFLVRAFHVINVRLEIEEGETTQLNIRLYRDTDGIVSNPDERTQLLRQIMKWLMDLRDKYKPYRELDPIFQAIDLVSRDFVSH